MAVSSSGFWPEDIKPRVQTPLAILRARANELTEITKGVLIGKVSSTSDTMQAQAYHSLDAVVPALRNLRQRLLTVRHGVKAVYPAYLDAKLPERTPFTQIAESLARFGSQGTAESTALSDEELLALLKEALRSPQVKSTLVSLIAMANEVTEESNGATPSNPLVNEGNQEIEAVEPDDDSE